ncbi:T9SS type B sorting domain-containing protein [Flavobacterium sufflavum]|uniref:T9SS type B sorting domain-containing protein n=1 Tax=Flavobacterium sufflavum TaxID=1921138 RepID=A0A437KXU8_9FLAO|nr:T9SS type B sorting domain-containing protein [Flavobacterium sufflavum]RVT77407.1 T9SS type B sorting domain-containing protein [Flavobacterium sufflavum]
MKRILLFLFLLIFIPLFSQNNNHSIGFKENKGQIIDQNGNPNNSVKYLLNTNGLNVQLKQNGFSYDIYETKKIPIKQRIEENNTFSSITKNDKKTADYTLEYVFHRIDIDFVNSNPNAELISSEKSQDYDNYYNIPNHPEGIVGVHQYKQITYKNIYPNIDVVFSIPKDSLKAVEYNFVVHPKGKISDIQLKFNGAKNELVDNKIRMNVRFGKMEETLPASWIEDGMIKKSIDVGYKKIKNNVYGFNTSNSVNGKTVIIDPVPIRLWGTYYGGEKEEYTLCLEKDVLGNAYICGTTSSINFIATSDAHQNTFGSSIYYGPHLYITDGFISKFDKNGTRLWSTFYGGNLDDDIKDLAVSGNGTIGFCGNSWSNNNISTTGTFKDFKSGSYGEMFFGTLNSSGVRLWASYFGDDSGRNFMNTIVFDSNNFLYIGGTTSSINYIANIGSPPTSSYDFNGFISKFSINGQQIWGAYFGGGKEDFIEDLTIDSNNNIIAVGYTNSTSGISTPNSFQQYLNKSTLPSNLNYDGFITSFTNTGNLNWGTYFGSSENDKILRVKNFNNVLYISGTSNSLDLSTPNAFETIAQSSTSFISKFNIQNQQKIWLSYSAPIITDFDINQNEEIYLVGNSSYSANIATPNAFNPNSNGFISYIRKINNNCQIIWGTYLGNSGFINNPYVKCVTSDIFYVSGTCWSTRNINHGLTTTNSFQEFSNGEHESYLNKFQECLLSPEVSSNSPICIGNTLELKASGGTNYSWTGPNGFTSTDQNPIILNATVLNSGQYSCLITGTGGCYDTKKVDVVIGDIQAPIPNLTTLPTITGDCHTQITTIPTATDVCAGVITGTTTSPLLYNSPGTYTIIWNYNDGNGNSINQNQTVTIARQPLPIVNTPQTFCIQQNATINNITITGQNIKWFDALTNGNLLSNTTSLQNGKIYYASQTTNGCESERIAVLINIQNTPAPTGDTNQSFCSTQNATLNNIEITGTNIKWYNSSNIALPNTTLIGNNATYYATQTINNCESINKLAINTTLINTLNANNYKVEFCDENNDGKETINLSEFNPNLIVNPSDNSFSYYTTLTAAENQIANNRINNINNYVLPKGSYTVFVRIDSPNGCHQVVELGLNLYSKPIIPINDITPICEGGSITVNAGAGYDNYLWSTGETSPTITIQNPGDYSVTVTNTYDLISCSSTKNFTVKKSTIATINTIETKDWTDNQNIIKVFVSREGDFEYSIDGIHFQDNNEFSNVITGQYTVQVRDKNGCGTATEEVYLLMYPKFFTPNGDGYNDNWKIKFSDSEKNITIKIFDRYGKLLKQLLPDASWNGQFNNQELPASDYWFIVTRADGKEYKGHFSLKR